MRRVNAPTVHTMRRSVAVVGASLSLLLIPVAAAAAQSPSPTPASTESSNQSSPSLRLGVPTLSVPTLSVPTLSVPTLSVPTLSVPTLSLSSLSIPLILDLGGLVDLGSGSATSTPPTSSGGNTSPAPPTTSHPSSTSPTHPATSGEVLPIGGGQPGGYSSSTQPTFRSTTSAPPRDTKGTGSLVLIKRLLGNSGVLMIAAVLAATALAVIALARLGGVRRGRRAPRQH